MSYVIPEYLQRWERPPNYIGMDWSDCYVLYGTHRDADLLTRSNFQAIIAELEENYQSYLVNKGEDHEKNGRMAADNGGGFIVAGARHWAVGWIETILIPVDSPLLELADEIRASIESYPVYDESLYSDMEYNEVQEWWGYMTMKERIYYIKDYCSDLSIFSARRNDPFDVDDGFYYYLSERL